MAYIGSEFRSAAATARMRAQAPKRAGFPIADERAAYRRWLIVEREQCPECGGVLDTGWECGDCGHDGRVEARQTIDAAIAGEEADAMERAANEHD